MIINASQGNIEVFGDIKEFKTSIDPKNLEFITTLLSSNLYSNPEQSFIREIVSNAWDSHVEAGTTDTPVIVRFKNDNYNKSITIRDYGTGLSPERFKEVYCNIGSSTKRDSNNFIGGFGIGKYSSLACSNTVYITSYYNGIAYYYIMVKSGNSITTNLVNEQPTTEKNGVEVTIKNIQNLAPYKDALDYIVFFPNVYIDGISTYINNVKLKRFKNFAASTNVIDHKLLLGNVLYPCNSSLLPQDAKYFIDALRYTGIVISFEIGELNITPNRESIIYTSDTIEKISKRIIAAKEELEAIIDAKIRRDYQDLVKYFEAVRYDVYYNPVTDATNAKFGEGYRIPHQTLRKSITYRGINLENSFDDLDIILSTRLPNFKTIIYEGKFYSKKLPCKVQKLEIICGAKKILMCKHGTRLISSIKSFLKDNYYECTTIIETVTKKDVKAHIENKIADLGLDSINPNKQLIIDGIYEHIMSKATVIDFSTDADYLMYKQDLATNKISPHTELKEIILYRYEYHGWRIPQNFKESSEAIEYLKELKSGVIIANMDEDDMFWTKVAEVKGFVFFKARKDVVKAIRELNLSCVVDMGWLLREDPLINKVYTAFKYFPYRVNKDLVAELMSTIKLELVPEIAKVLKYLDYNTVYVNHCKDSGKIDPYTEYICKNLESYLDKYAVAKQVVTDYTDVYCGERLSRVLTTAVIVKTGAYRVNPRAYNELKSNKLLRILCRK